MRPSPIAVFLALAVACATLPIPTLAMATVVGGFGQFKPADDDVKARFAGDDVSSRATTPTCETRHMALFRCSSRHPWPLPLGLTLWQSGKLQSTSLRWCVTSHWWLLLSAAALCDVSYTGGWREL